MHIHHESQIAQSIIVPFLTVLPMASPSCECFLALPDESLVLILSHLDGASLVRMKTVRFIAPHHVIPHLTDLQFHRFVVGFAISLRDSNYSNTLLSSMLQG